MMRKGCLLGILAVSGLGCLSPGSNVEKEAQKNPPVRMAEAPPPIITADQITDANAPQKAQALAQEMDYEINHSAAPAMTANSTNP